MRDRTEVEKAERRREQWYVDGTKIALCVAFIALVAIWGLLV